MLKNQYKKDCPVSNQQRKNYETQGKMKVHDSATQVVFIKIHEFC